MALAKLQGFNELAKQEGKKYQKKREFFNRILNEKGRHFVGVVGPRGVGKTILLKQITSAIDDSFYLSIDTFDETDDLFKIAKTLIEKYKIRLLLVDEIHFQKNFEKALKQIFDFLSIRIIFTSSVSLSLFESSYDLSRRVNLLHLYPFSFREYIFFKTGASIVPLALKDILQKNWGPEHLRYGYLFEEYLKGNLFPFSLEEPEPLSLLKNALQKIIYKDIPSVSPLHMEELATIEKIVKYLGNAPVDGVNFTSVAKNIGITNYKAEEYIRLLEKAFVLNPIYPIGTNVLKEPKILMYLSFRLLYKSYWEALGALREDFFAQALKMRGVEFHYLKTNRGAKTPDFLIDHNGKQVVIEVGGKGKGRQQFKGVKAETKLILTHSEEMGGKTPLFLLGFI